MSEQNLTNGFVEVQENSDTQLWDQRGGFNVLCVNDSGVHTGRHIHPNGVVEKGKVYRVLRVSADGSGFIILGKPTICDGAEVHWWAWRFIRISKKL